MPRFASFSPFKTTGTPGAGGMTLDALMLRQKDLAKNATQLPAAQDMASPWQGFAYLGNKLADTLAQNKTAADVSASRDALSKAIAMRDPVTGELPPEAQATVMNLDPDIGMKFIADTMAARREKAQYERNRADTLADYQTRRADTLADVQTGYKHEGEVNTREETEEAARNQRELEEAQAAEQAKRDWEKNQEQAQHDRDLAEATKVAADKAAAGVEHIVTGEDAKKLGGDPTRQYKVKVDGSGLSDVTPDVPETFRPPTQEEITKFKLDPTKPFRVSTKTGKPEEIGGNTLQLISPEVGAKLGLSDEFLKNYDSVVNAAKAGDLTGPIDVTESSMGRGAGANAYGIIKQGTEGLIRLMTGAGMNEQEAKDRVSQYEPSYTDDSASLLGKLERLKNAIQAVREGATFGRNAPAAPAAGGGTAAPAAPANSALDSALDQYRN